MRNESISVGGRLMYIRKYLLAGGLVSMLALGACSDETPEAGEDPEETEQSGGGEERPDEQSPEGADQNEPEDGQNRQQEDEEDDGSSE